jgi:hypothetical protein
VYADFVPIMPTQMHTTIFHQAARLRLQPRREHDVQVIPKQAKNKVYLSNGKAQRDIPYITQTCLQANIVIVSSSQQRQQLLLSYFFVLQK